MEIFADSMTDEEIRGYVKKYGREKVQALLELPVDSDAEIIKKTLGVGEASLLEKSLDYAKEAGSKTLESMLTTQTQGPISRVGDIIATTAGQAMGLDRYTPPIVGSAAAPAGEQAKAMGILGGSRPTAPTGGFQAGIEPAPMRLAPDTAAAQVGGALQNFLNLPPLPERPDLPQGNVMDVAAQYSKPLGQGMLDASQTMAMAAGVANPAKYALPVLGGIFAGGALEGTGAQKAIGEFGTKSGEWLAENVPAVGPVWGAQVATVAEALPQILLEGAVAKTAGYPGAKLKSALDNVLPGDADVSFAGMEPKGLPPHTIDVDPSGVARDVKKFEGTMAPMNMKVVRGENINVPADAAPPIAPEPSAAAGSPEAATIAESMKEIESIFGPETKGYVPTKLQQELSGELGTEIGLPKKEKTSQPEVPVPAGIKGLEKLLGKEEAAKVAPKDIQKRYNDVLDIAAIEQNQYSTSPFDPLKSGNTLGSLLETPDAASLPKGKPISVDALTRATEAKKAAEAPVLAEGNQKVTFELNDGAGVVTTMTTTRDAFNKAKAKLDAEGNGHLIKEITPVESLKPGEATPAPSKPAKTKLEKMVEDLEPDATPEQIAARYPAPDLPAIDKPVPRMNRNGKAMKGTGESFLDIAKKYMSGEDAIVEANRLAEEWKAKNTADSYDGVTPAMREKGYAGEDARHKARGQALKGGITPIYSYIKRNYTGINAESLIAAGMKGELADTNMVKPKGGARWSDIVEAIRQDGFAPKDMMDQEIMSALVDEYNLRKSMKETQQGRSQLAMADKALAEVLKEGIEGPYAATEGPMMYSGLPLDKMYDAGGKVAKAVWEGKTPLHRKAKFIADNAPALNALTDSARQEAAALNYKMFGAQGVAGGPGLFIDAAMARIGLQPPSAVYPFLTSNSIKAYESGTKFEGGIAKVARQVSKLLTTKYLTQSEMDSIGPATIKSPGGIPDVKMTLPEYKAWILGLEKGKKVAGVTVNDLVAMGLEGVIPVEKLPAGVQASVKVVRTIFDRIADALGMTPEERRSNYYPHVFTDPGILRKIRAEYKTEADFINAQKQNYWTAGDYGIEIHDPYLRARVGVQGWSLDWQQALQARVRAASRKIFMEPVITQIRDTAAQLKSDGTLTGEFQGKFLEDYAKMLNGDVSTLDKGIDNAAMYMFEKMGANKLWALTDKLNQTKFAQFMRDKQAPVFGDYIKLSLLPQRGFAKNWSRLTADAMYFSIMAYALPTGIKNLFQGVNTAAYHGVGRTTLGAARLLTRKGFNEFLDSGIMADMDNIADGVGSSNFGGKLVKGLTKVAYGPMLASEFINRGIAFNTALLEAKVLQKRGILPQGQDVAFRHALGSVRKTQFQYGITETTPWMNNSVGRVFRVLGTYPQRQAAFLRELATRPNDAKIMGINAGMWRYLIITGAMANGALTLGVDVSDSVGAMKADEFEEKMRQLPFGVGIPAEWAASKLPDDFRIPLVGTPYQLAEHWMGKSPGGQAIGAGIDLGKRAFTDDPREAERLRESIDKTKTDLEKRLLFGSMAPAPWAATRFWEGKRNLENELKTGKVVTPSGATYRITPGDAYLKALALKPKVQQEHEAKIRELLNRKATQAERSYEGRKAAREQRTERQRR